MNYEEKEVRDCSFAELLEVVKQRLLETNGYKFVGKKELLEISKMLLDKVVI